jgi:hypothetical protein
MPPGSNTYTSVSALFLLTIAAIEYLHFEGRLSILAAGSRRGAYIEVHCLPFSFV